MSVTDSTYNVRWCWWYWFHSYRHILAGFCFNMLKVSPL